MLTSAEMVHNNHYINVVFKNGNLVDLTIQEQDGTVLFTGNPVQAQNLSNALSYVLNYDFSFNETGSNDLEDDRQDYSILGFEQIRESLDKLSIRKETK